MSYFEGGKAACEILYTSAQRRDPTAFFQVRMKRTRTLVADYVGKVTPWLESPMRGLLIYRKGDFYGMEVHNCLYGDQCL